MSVGTQTSTMTVKELWRYPVKSMAGEQITHSLIRANGFLGDRRYALVDVETEEVVCAKVVRKWGMVMNFMAVYAEEPHPEEKLPPLHITFPDGSVHMSDTRNINSLLSKELGRDVELVTRTRVPAMSEALWQVVEGHEATEWTRQRTVSRVNNQDLVRFQLAEGVPVVGEEETFFDLAPIHILTTGSIKQFEELASGVSFDARRFRPNIIIETDETGFVEQGWLGKTMRIGEAALSLTIPVPRCVMPNLEQHPFGLTADNRVLKTLAQYCTHEVEALGSGRWVVAGIYANALVDAQIDVGSTANLSEE